MNRRDFLLTQTGAALAAPAASALAQPVNEDWPSFLGPTHNCVSRETQLRRDWSAQGPKLLWEFRKGTGYSSPAIAGGVLVYFHRQGNEERVEALDPRTGAARWSFAYPTRFEDRYGYNNGPRSSPVISNGRVFTYGAEGKLHAFTLATGKLEWKRDVAAEFKVPQDFFGTATTPLIEDSKLIVNVGAPGGPCVAAFDCATGKTLWTAGKEWGPSYASPVPAVIHGQRRVFVFAGGESNPPTGGLLCINPLNGAIDFSFPFRSRSYESVNASNPVVIGNRVFLSASYKTGGVMLEVTPEFRPRVAWESREIGTHFMTAVHLRGHLYAFDGRNEPDASLVCIDAETGRLVWRHVAEWQESVGARTIGMSPYRGTLLSADGAFLCLGEWGHLLWLDLSPKGFKELKRVWLFAARESWSLPVLSQGLLYISQHTRDAVKGAPPRLLAYDLRSP